MKQTMSPLKILQIASMILAVTAFAFAQPRIVMGGVRFTYSGEAEKSVALLGDFNGWSKYENQMQRDSAGVWSVQRKISAGIFQYKFLIDNIRYENDSLNPATIDNYNSSARNSVFVLTQKGEILLSSTPPQHRTNAADEYPTDPGKKPVYLNIIWHQHQPLYVNPETDQLSGPWVRTHATKDYYDMAAMLRRYPEVHCNINLTSSLLHQLRQYYVDRLRPFVDTKNNRIDVAGFWKKWKGKTDPWIDLALKPTADFDATDRSFLYKNSWNAFGINDVMIARFPEYLALKRKLDAGRQQTHNMFSEQEMREIKFWFYLAHFDPDFLRGPVQLPDGSVCDLSDRIEIRSDKKFYLKKPVTETDCQRIVAETYKVMANIIPVHKGLRYDPSTKQGQVEIITTPYYHPILPLIYDSDLARICQPLDSLPPRFSYAQDARAQVAKAVKMYREIFGFAPTGMWPGEGSVAQPILSVLRSNGIIWTASDMKVLQRSDPPNQPNTTPYQFAAGNNASPESDQSIALVFRDTDLSDRIGFTYQNYEGEAAAEDFVQSILACAPAENERDVLVTVILDGENAWEWYRQDIDAKEFLHAFYRKLSTLYSMKQIITTTTTEYLVGNPRRGIQPHPVEKLPSMNRLWPGSWINANYDTWIGEPEENTAWEYLLHARKDLERTGIKQPDPIADPPKQGTKAWYAYSAWEEMYAAQGSDWFWWYGSDQTAPGGDKPFDDAFRLHLRNMYRFARLAGSSIEPPAFDPIVKGKQDKTGGPAQSDGAANRGVMARSRGEMQKVLFTCDARDQKVPNAIYIVGNIEELAAWVPNTVRMYDNGTHGDVSAGDGIWSLEVEVAPGTEIQYKFTNSGKRGEWIPGEEFPMRNRTLTVKRVTAKLEASTTTITHDIFGK